MTMLAPIHTNTLLSVIHMLTDTGPVVTYDQIEATLTDAGIDPATSAEAYEAVLDALAKQGVQVVESLSAPTTNDQQELDAELWEMLRANRLPLDIYRHPLLSAARERRLLEVYRLGQQSTSAQALEAAKQAHEELLRCNVRLVASVAYRYRFRVSHLTIDDLIQEGMIGLNRAIEMFKLDEHTRLSTYATWWIRQAITRAIADTERAIRLPVHVHETIGRIRRTYARLQAERGHAPSEQEIAAELGIPEQKLVALRMAAVGVASLDQAIDDGGTTLGALLADRVADSPEWIVEEKILRDVLKDAIALLSEREQYVLVRRFGLDNQPEATLEVIGRSLGVTRERVRQIEVKALRRLRHPRIGLRFFDSESVHYKSCSAAS